MLLWLALAGGAVSVHTAGAQESSPQRTWHQAPTISVMTGFIYEPLKPYTVQQWLENLGHKFDADQWVADFQEAGASHVVFYDKWIDGLVFHDTQTTGFKTKRDFVRELAAACQRRGLPLVLYFNAISDGNPEFDRWALLDQQGRPIVFSANWPTRYQTLHSPFRQACVEQVRELLSNYGPIHGLWLDIFAERVHTASEWTARGYQQMFGEPFETATGPRLAEFQVRTLAGYLDEIDAIRRQQGQQQCAFTANGSGSAFLGGGGWTEQVGARLQYLYNEGHGFQANERLARMAWALPKPLDINLLLVSSWFTPLDDTPPPASLTAEQAIAATAIAVCQGAGVNFALTPAHDGRFGEDVQRAKAVGAWFRRIQPWLRDAQPAAEVGIVPGPNAEAATAALASAGVFSRWLPIAGPLPTCRAIVVPPHSRWDERLRRYVADGGTLIGCGNLGPFAEMFGVSVQGAVRFTKELRGATVKVDSEYNAQFAASNLLDDVAATAWASDGTPMPHWAEITLPEPVEVREVQLLSRQGPYQVVDVDVELPDGDGWRVVRSIRGAAAPKIIAELPAPAKTDRVRVRILRELYEGQDRQYADVAALRVLDSTGSNQAKGTVTPVRVLGELAGQLPPSALAVTPTTADVLARWDQPHQPPAVLRNRFGKGHAWLVTCDTLPDDVPFWSALRQHVLGEPTYLVSAKHAERYRFVLTRVGADHVLHVIDAAVPAKDYQPVPVAISLAGPAFGGIHQALLAESNQPVALARTNGRTDLTVVPGPVATVVLKSRPP
jgi:CheY-like chemotaxis protein